MEDDRPVLVQASKALHPLVSSQLFSCTEFNVFSAALDINRFLTILFVFVL